MAKYNLQVILEGIYEQYKNNQHGNVANYIPELAKANPNDFGIALVTQTGDMFEVGDSKKEFTIQSISKAFTYGFAIEAYGLNKVLQHVGVEPSGDAFNSIILQKDTNRPFNPMINAGAITIAALLYDHYGEESFDFILDRFSKAAGRQLSLDKNVYQSELNTGHRNRAIGHLLLNFGMIGEHVDKYLDLYFKQCSILVNCHDLAMMSATLANLGTQPESQIEIYQFGTVKDILSIMLTCGMYDYSGEWAFRVGVPAKSGVGGGVIATVNRQMGLAVYSPRLDDRGNSARGINVCIDLANEFGLHAFDCMNHGSDYLKAIL